MARRGSGSPVAFLLFCHPLRPSYTHYIFSNDEFDIGRKEIHRVWGTDELTISTHHLRFRCVIFEDGEEEKIAPLIYTRVLSYNPVVYVRTESNTPSDDIVLTNRSGDVLLNHGDVLRLTTNISLVFQAKDWPQSASNALDNVKQAELTTFAKQYVVTSRVLGAGGNASVFVAVKQSTQKQMACKILPLQRIQSNSHMQPDHAKALNLRLLKRRENLAREYSVLKNLSHPNIICLEKVFCTSYHIYIFQELITGGDLLSYIDQMGTLGEPQTAVIVRQVVKAVEYLHDNQVVHRDIKPENVLMTSWREGARIVLTDFGQARMLEDPERASRDSAVFRMRSIVGTYGYTAPEVYQQLKHDGPPRGNGYSKAIDMWSVGCLMATLLTNDLIFTDESEDYADFEYSSKDARACKPQYLNILNTQPEWQGIGQKAKSFVRGCLALKESLRLTAKQALQHEWFTDKHYAAELEAVNERAIADWMPRSKSDNIIEFIDTTDAVQAEMGSQIVQRSEEEIRSRYFLQPQPAIDPPDNALNKNRACLSSPRPKNAQEGIATDDFSYGRRPSDASNTWQPYAFSDSLVCVPNSTQGTEASCGHKTEEVIAANLVQPETQFTYSETLPPPPPSWDESIT